MRVVIERVKSASVLVEGEVVSEVGPGLLALVGVALGDDASDIEYVLKKLTTLRIFYDAEGKMNLSIKDVGGSILVVSQFTLLADVRKGRRPSFADAEEPEKANKLIDALCDKISDEGVQVKKGVFGADMQVEHINDGPVTILLDSRKLF